MEIKHLEGTYCGGRNGEEIRKAFHTLDGESTVGELVETYIRSVDIYLDKPAAKQCREVFERMPQKLKNKRISEIDAKDVNDRTEAGRVVGLAYAWFKTYVK